MYGRQKSCHQYSGVPTNFQSIECGSGLHGETEASESRTELDRFDSANLPGDFSQGSNQFNEKVILPFRRVGVLRIEPDINYAQERVLPRKDHDADQTRTGAVLEDVERLHVRDRRKFQ